MIVWKRKDAGFYFGCVDLYNCRKSLVLGILMLIGVTSLAVYSEACGKILQTLIFQ